VASDLKISPFAIAGASWIAAGHRKRLREGDRLEEATLNAALTTIDSMQPRSELQAVLAVQIIATGFAGLRFLRQSHRQMTEDFINVYGTTPSSCFGFKMR
jgi:hypothetical protein